MLVTNNRWILHNRTAFEDHAEPELRRHYVRLWLDGMVLGDDARLVELGSRP